MGANFGFVTTRPDAAHGDRTSLIGLEYAWAQRFTVAASGTFNLTEIGVWGRSGAAGAGYVVLGVFTHDATNNCPESLVTNSTSDAIELPTGSDLGSVHYHTYATKPQITSDGTTVYWLVGVQSVNLQLANTATGGTSTFRSATYPTWPSSGDWETNTDTAILGDYYAVYEAASSACARPSSDVAGGTFRSILVTAPFGPRVIA